MLIFVSLVHEDKFYSEAEKMLDDGTRSSLEFVKHLLSLKVFAKDDVCAMLLRIVSDVETEEEHGTQ